MHSCSLNQALLLAAVAAMFPAASGAIAQCSFDWQAGDGVPGVNGSASAVVSWDPDGAGPLPAVLAVGGSFQVAGRTLASNIAVWDGADFSPLGSGIGGTPDTY